MRLQNNNFYLFMLPLATFLAGNSLNKLFCFIGEFYAVTIYKFIPFMYSFSNCTAKKKF